ncbi:PREDICTED: uncharacterized protein LOC106809324 [Priapulus caudatus]|uniref:Uncharacterized protein LOC106809324 n=1 Tax=Priapulus caudatus TaxID=37621 RepID=A0ABM1E6N2_PRICU|nr:PREDICTED: uncharacterized protein LOC106809324 [Priapulus caudatus]
MASGRLSQGWEGVNISLRTDREIYPRTNKITDSAQYRAGFHQCASHIGRYSGVSPSVRARLAKHLRRSHATSTQATANDGKSDVDREGAPVEEMKEELRSPAASPVAMDTTRETNATPPSELGSVSSTHVNITSSPRVVSCEDHGEVPLKEYTWREQAGRDGVAATRLESGEVVLVFPTEAGSRHNMLFNSGLATPPSTPPSSPDHRTNEQGSMVFANVESVYAGQSVWRPW